MTQKSDNFDFFCESIDLSLIALQALDKYSYDYFFEKLKENDTNNILLFAIFQIRLKNQMNFFYENAEKRSFTKFIKNQKISRNTIKKIIEILSNVLNSKFCEQKLDFISFYFLPEYGLFLTKLKILELQKLIIFEFWVAEYKKRFSFLFIKLLPRSFNRKLYPFLINIYLQNGLRYLIFYKNV